jgi:hypothetical protein
MDEIYPGEKRYETNARRQEKPVAAGEFRGGRR